MSTYFDSHAGDYSYPNGNPEYQRWYNANRLNYVDRFPGLPHDQITKIMENEYVDMLEKNRINQQIKQERFERETKKRQIDMQYDLMRLKYPVFNAKVNISEIMRYTRSNYGMIYVIDEQLYDILGRDCKFTISYCDAFATKTRYDQYGYNIKVNNDRDKENLIEDFNHYKNKSNVNKDEGGAFLIHIGDQSMLLYFHFNVLDNGGIILKGKLVYKADVKDTTTLAVADPGDDIEDSILLKDKTVRMVRAFESSLREIVDSFDK